MLNLQFAVLALFLPVGLILVAGGALAGRRPAKSAVAGLGALALAAISYWAVGFAFHLGGVGLVSDLTGLEGLVWEWASPVNLDWGVMGLRGFFLLDEASTPAALNLYLAYLPALAVAVILPLLSLRERMPGWMAALGGLVVATLVYPVVGNWFSGGGWLMHIGDTLGLGHGYVDLMGVSTAAVVGGLAALLGILFFSRRLPPLPEGELLTLPPVHRRREPHLRRSRRLHTSTHQPRRRHSRRHWHHAPWRRTRRTLPRPGCLRPSTGRCSSVPLASQGRGRIGPRLSAPRRHRASPRSRRSSRRRSRPRP